MFWMPNRTGASNHLGAFHSVRSLQERTPSSCRGQVAAARNASASSTATYTRQFDEDARLEGSRLICPRRLLQAGGSWRFGDLVTVRRADDPDADYIAGCRGRSEGHRDDAGGANRDDRRSGHELNFTSRECSERTRTDQRWGEKAFVNSSRPTLMVARAMRSSSASG